MYRLSYFLMSDRASLSEEEEEERRERGGVEWREGKVCNRCARYAIARRSASTIRKA